jgi:hypothetical protein
MISALRGLVMMAKAVLPGGMFSGMNILLWIGSTSW